MKLYYTPGACSLASHIALYETGLSFEAVQVEGRESKTAGTENYADVTSKGYVPALRLDDGSVLTESTAILPYIGDLKPSHQLSPVAGTMARYRMHEWLGYINSELHKNFGPFFSPGVTEEQKSTAKVNLGRRFDFIQHQLTGIKYLVDDKFTVADCYLFTVLGWCNYIQVDLGQWPGLKAYYSLIVMRPTVQAAMKAEGLIK